MVWGRNVSPREISPTKAKDEMGSKNTVYSAIAHCSLDWNFRDDLYLYAEIFSWRKFLHIVILYDIREKFNIIMYM